MAAPIVSLIENYVSGFDDSVGKTLTKRLLDKAVSLIELIEKLRDFLTSKENNTRARATRLISDILHNLPQDWLVEKEVSLLCTYLCEKLKDHHSLQPHAVYGLLALCKSPKLNTESLESVCQTIFKELHTQSLSQGDRRSVFNIFYTLLSTRLPDVQKLGADFVYGYLQVMDGEKDPRNLVIAFTCAQIVIQNLPLSVFVEEMFEVVSCYFPVDFSPSANDPSGIKKEDLVLGLRRCLAATPKFAEHCLPLLIEKLTSDLKSAKIDSLETLAMCAGVYGAENMYEFQSSFFNCIKKEIFLSGDPAVEQAALSALTAIVATIATGVTQSDRKRSLDGYVEEILNECKNHLLQPELMLMLSTGRILQAAALGSDLACAQIVKTTIPLLVEAYHKQTQPTPRHNVLLVLNGFLGVAATYKDKDSSLLSIYKMCHVLHIYTTSLDDETVSIQQLAIRGLNTLVSLPGDFLTEEEVSNVADKLVNKTVQVTCEPDVRHEIAAVLQCVMLKYPATQSHIYPVLFKLLQNECMEVAGCETLDKVGVLDLLPGVTQGPDNVRLVTDQLYTLLDKPESLDLYQPLTRCLSVISEKCCLDKTCVETLYSGVRIVHDLVTTKCRCVQSYKVLTNSEVLKNIAAFIRYQACMWDSSKSLEVQTIFVNSYLKNISSDTCYHGDNLDIFKGQPAVFSPLKASCDTVFVCLLTPVVCSAPVQLQGSIPCICEVLDRLCELMVQPLEREAHTHVCKCLAAILNKQQTGESLDKLLESLKDKLTCALSSEGQGHTVKALSWVTKSLVLRGHSLAKQFVDMLMSLLSDGTHGREAAQGFSIILTDCDDVLTREMHANVRLMYRQRFFLEHLPATVSGYEQSCKDTKKNYLLALSFLIQGLNKQVLIPEMPKIYPLLIQSLLCDDLDLQMVTMETLSDLICSAPQVVDKQIDSLVPQLLKMSAYKPSMKVRISALKCLSELTMLPVHVLIPYRARVTRALLPVLDDKKRLVRAQAVQARQEWFLLDMEKK